ncbi:MAG TPA: maleylpyruvate isomerase family mycothiol-dependent enzyme [Pseudonocardiaceae bacterium]|jgi:uncharacterized protein (TIGR03083 family)|nr:maleylpyruvate isomerase family mycothiol-dependent enzyme [Pseudonocardiaceae bacterium]
MSEQVLDLAQREREDLVTLLATLSPEQWLAPSLCTGWRVRDVVGHLIGFDELSFRQTAARFARGRFIVSRINDIGVAALADRSTDELVDIVRRHTRPRGWTTSFGGLIALTDGLIHHQDIRRALDLPRQVPAERLVRILPFARIAPPVGALWRARGLRLVATDLGWAAGRGPELRGPGEALLLGITGRGAVLDELDGPGARILGNRMGG